MQSYRITGVTTLYEGWSKLLKLSISKPDGGTMEREVEDHGAAIAVLPYDPERRMAMLVRQFRAPVLHEGGLPNLLEAPAGMLDEDDPQACARREANEEVGLNLRSLEPLGTAWACPGLSTPTLQPIVSRRAAGSRTSTRTSKSSNYPFLTSGRWWSEGRSWT
jgi:8-oxo-dGTP pyrophosphatase MutT (NUDIX family)